MLKNQLIQIIFIIVVLIFSFFQSKIFAFSNEDKRKACELYNKAYENMNDVKSSNDKLINAEKLLMEAISIIPEDTNKIHYEKTESLLQHGNSRFPRYENVVVTKSQSYKPNKLLIQVRSKIPPEPWALVQINEQDSKFYINLTIYNNGKSYMEDIKISIKGDIPFLSSQKIDSIMPKSKESIQWSTISIQDNLLNSLCIKFEEKYGFAPSDIRFNP